MPPTRSNDKSAYKSKIKLDLEIPKNGEIQATKVALAKIYIKKIVKNIGVLSEDVKMYMYLSDAKLNTSTHYVSVCVYVCMYGWMVTIL